MSTLRSFMMLAAVVFAGATAHADKPTADKPTADKPTLNEAEAQWFYAFFEKVVNIVVANKEDCAKMAAGINAHIDASQALLKEANAARSAGKHLPAAIKEKITKKTKEELAPGLQHKCSTDKPVMEALNRMKVGK